MRITVEDVEMVNWEAVTERLGQETQQELARVIASAQQALKALEPGERKTIAVRVGSLTVARPK